MPYITVVRPPRYQQISFEDILRGEVEIPAGFFQPQGKTADTITRFYPNIGREIVRRFDIPSTIRRLERFCSHYDHLFKADRQSLYRTFHIPKRSGGLRRIDAPNEELTNALRELKRIIETSAGPLYHTSAFAYVTGRSTIDAIRRHQSNESKWFLKTDFSDFFGSTTETFLYNMVSQIFPFSELPLYMGGEEALRKALSLCFLNGGLPQGTVCSPMLTNLMMIPVDFKLANSLKKRGFVYTRYADDILISHKRSFMFSEITKEINDTLHEFGAPFRLKPEKTRYGSSNGSNWNLGLMLNKDNEITIGWRKKKQLRAMATSYVLDKRNEIQWDPHDVAVFNGLLAYCKMVEPTFLAQLIRTTNEKYQVDLMKLIHDDLNGGNESGQTPMPDLVWGVI